MYSALLDTLNIEDTEFSTYLEDHGITAQFVEFGDEEGYDLIAYTSPDRKELEDMIKKFFKDDDLLNEIEFIG